MGPNVRIQPGHFENEKGLLKSFPLKTPQGKNGSKKLTLNLVTTTVSEHFLFHSNHSHTDMQLIPLEKIHSSRDSNLIDKAMTLEPNGLNRRDELL